METVNDQHAAVLLRLLGWGVFYNWLVARLEKKGYDRGYMGFIVSGGVFGVIVGFTVLVGSLDLGMVLLACFAAAGLPMVIGSVARYNEARTREEELLDEVMQRLTRAGGEGADADEEKDRRIRLAWGDRTDPAGGGAGKKGR